MPSGSWRRHHPGEFPRDMWLDWLAASGDQSPFLLPEWGPFWEMVWPGSRAEVWVRRSTNGDVETVVPLVRRWRFGLEMCYAQPMGAPCGPIMPGASDFSTCRFDELVDCLVGPLTVELAVCPNWIPEGAICWGRRLLTARTWVVRLNPGLSDRGFLDGLAESHTRQIALGERLAPRLGTVADPDHVTGLLAPLHKHRQPHRFLLDPVRAKAIACVFGPAGALRLRAAWVGDDVKAAVMFLVHADRAVYLDGFFARERAVRGAGYALFADTLRSMAAEGIHEVDLGGGPGEEPVTGLDRFKRGWGAIMRTRETGLYRRGWYHRLRRLVRPG